MTMENKAFKEYLATGKFSKEAVAEDAAIVIAMQMQEDPILRLLAYLVAVEIVAKDLHYRAKGKSFYGVHLLSDLVWDIRSERDELNEIYYMGEKKTLPPLGSLVFGKAAEIAKACESNPYGNAEDGMLSGLKKLVDTIIQLVEDAKVLSPKAGTNAVLDEISKKMLTNSGLLDRTLSPDRTDETGCDKGCKREHQIDQDE